MANRFLSNITINDSYTFPSADGDAGQIIGTDGAGNLSFVDQTTEALTLNVTVKNISGGSLAKGTIVHAHPSANPPSGNVVEVIAADYDTSASMPAIGVLNETLANEAEGQAIMFGAVSGIDTSSFSAGDELWVGNNGAFTNTKPATAGRLIQKIAVVIKSHASNGLIKIFGAGRTNDVPLPLYIDNANQNVGIGTFPDSDSELHVYKNGGPARVRIQREFNPQLDLESLNGYARIGTLNNFPLVIQTNGSERMRIDSNGNVGIGTTSPQDRLHVYSNYGDQLRLSQGGTTNYLNINSGSAYSSLGGGSAFREDITISHSDGNVGIGTSPSSYKLEVAGDTNLSSTAYSYKINGVDVLNVSTTYTKLYNPEGAIGLYIGDSADRTNYYDNNYHAFRNAGGSSVLAALNSNGYIVGGTSPSAKLTVDGETNGRGIELKRTGDLTGNAYLRLVGVDTQEALGFSVNNSEKARITYDGKMGIGTPSPSAELHVKGAGEVIRLQGDTGQSYMTFYQGTGSRVGYIGTSGTSGMVLESAAQLHFYSGGSSTMYLDSNSNVGIGTTSPSEKLEVNGAVKITNVGAAQLILRGDSNNTDDAGQVDGVIDFLHDDGGFGYRLNTENYAGKSAFNIQEHINGTLTSRLYIDLDGNVGINTVDPKQKFHVSGGAASGDVTKVVIGATGTNAESYLYLAENFSGDNVNYGFSFVADGNSSNNLLIKRHSNSTSGSTVITVNRDNDNVSFAGDVTANHYFADTHFRSTDTAATLSTTGAGIVYLRPNGYNQTTGQFRVFNDGSAVVSGALKGPSTFYIDPSPDDTGEPGGATTDTGTVVILGDLQVTGTTTTIDSTTLNVGDKNIVLAKDATTAAAANGAGITINGANATMTYISSDDRFEFNKAIRSSSHVLAGSNVYSGDAGNFRNYGGVWKATTGISGNGFGFISADGTAMTISSTGFVDINNGLLVNGGGSNFDTIRIEAPNASVYYKDSDSSTAWHLGSNGDYFYLLEDTDRNGVYNIINSRWNTAGYEQYTGSIDVRIGSYQIGGVTVINASRNLTNIGTISSGDITIGDGTADNSLTVKHSDNSYTEIHGYGIQMSRSASYIRPTSDASQDLYIGNSGTSTDWRYIYFKYDNSIRFNKNGTETFKVDDNTTIVSGNLVMGSNTVIDSNRNITANDYRSTGTFYLTSGDDWRFRSTGGTERMRITSAGNVGIGTNAPDAKLHVSGDVTFGEKRIVNLPAFYMGSGSITDEYLVICKQAPSGSGVSASGIQGRIVFSRGSSGSYNNSHYIDINVQMSFDNGSVNNLDVNQFEIVTDQTVHHAFTQIEEIDISGTKYVALKARSSGGGHNNHFYFEGSISDDGADTNILSRVRASDANVTVTSPQPSGYPITPYIVKNNSGQVGIGTVPTEKLQVSGTARATTMVTEGTSYAGTGFEHWGDGGTGINFPSNDVVSLKTSGSDRLYINSLGDIGIGTSLPSSKLTVIGDSYLNGKVGIGITPTTTWDLRIKGQYPLGLQDSSGVATFEFYADLKENRYLNGSKIVGYNQDLSIDTTSSSYDILLANNGGKVGIGTNAPTEKLQVNGVIRIPYNSTNSYYYGQDNGAIGFGKIFPFANTGLFTFDTNYTSGGGYAFKYNGAEKVRITDTGNVGIGTASPDTKLHIALSGGSAQLTLERTGSGAGKAVLAGASEGLTVYDDAYGAKMYVGTAGTYNGRVGIGTTSPAVSLHVNGWGRFNGGLQLDGNNRSIYAIYNTNLLLGTNNTERMRITNSGDVGIGQTSPIAKLDVSGAVRAGGKTTYGKAYSSLDTTGQAVAGLVSGGNGQSCAFIFTCVGGSGYQKIVYNCINVSGTWSVSKDIDEGANAFDVVASANAATITFTFKGRTANQAYTPQVSIEHIGSGLNTTYL